MPKGTLLIIGGAEDKGGNDQPDIKDLNNQFVHFEILRELLPRKNRTAKKIEIISTASDVPDEVHKSYISAFKEIGYKDISFLDIKDKSDARSKEFCERIARAHAVFFTGGDQFKLSSILGGTACTSMIREKYKYDKDFVIAGTSAGAMVMPQIMIYEGGVHEAILKDDLKTTSGLSLIEGCIVDTHFIKRGRFGRLAQAVVMNPDNVGIGLGEDTAMIIKNGKDAECRGSGMVVIIDGSGIDHTNIWDADTDSPVTIENLKVHILAKGSRFSIKERDVIKARKIVDKQLN